MRVLCSYLALMVGSGLALSRRGIPKFPSSISRAKCRSGGGASGSTASRRWEAARYRWLPVSPDPPEPE
jgi:hypothetical protein